MSLSGREFHPSITDSGTKAAPRPPVSLMLLQILRLYMIRESHEIVALVEPRAMLMSIECANPQNDLLRGLSPTNLLCAHKVP